MNLFEMGLAFLEGLALIASPCILPVLPLILATSVEGGRSKPFGIITGFVFSFSLFAFAARKLIMALGVELDILKNASLLLLLLLGCVMLSKTLSEKFSALTQGFSNLSSRIPHSGNNGLISGIGTGALIGLVWTPCAGPILATVLVQVIRQETDIAGFLIIFAFALGTGIPMLIIALTGRKILSKAGFLTLHADLIRKIMGIIIILAVLLIASGIDPTSWFSSNTTSSDKTATSLEEALEKPYPAPDFTGIESWLNTDPLTMKNLKGKVVLVDFWTYSCINCIRTLPYITDWDQKYRDKGLVIVGIHSPEFAFEKKRENVKMAIEKYGIHYPVALDNKLDTWKNFRNRYWPAHYLINQEGQVIYTHFGEGKYDVTENNIRFLLGAGDKIQATKKSTYDQQQTPETYLGYQRAKNFHGTLVRNQESNYQFPASLPKDAWALSGNWKSDAEKIMAGSASATLQLHFRSKKVFLVLGSNSGKAVKANITLNGNPLTTSAGKDVVADVVTVKQHTLYELVNQDNSRSGLLEIKALEPGLEAYAFTFGD